MKITSRVMLRKPDLPDREAWQAALHSHGFDLALPEDFDPLVFSGVVRCRIETPRLAEGGLGAVKG